MPTSWYNEYSRFLKLSKASQLALLKNISRHHPWLYLVAPMGSAERRFYNARIKRPTKDK